MKSILCRMSFVSNYSFKSSWVSLTPGFGQTLLFEATYKLHRHTTSNLGFGILLKNNIWPYAPVVLTDPLQLSQNGWEVSLNCHLEVSPQMFYGVSFWALVRKETCPEATSELSWLGFGPLSQISCTLEQVFFRNFSVFGCIHPSLNSDQSPCSSW